MTDMEMDLMIANAEILSLQEALRRQENLIANQKNHIAALKKAIDDLRKQLGGGSDG